MAEETLKVEETREYTTSTEGKPEDPEKTDGDDTGEDTGDDTGDDSGDDK